MKLLEFAIQTALASGKIILEKSSKPLKISEKGKNDLVTNADLASEKFIKNAISKAFPDHAILAEESAGTPAKTSKLFTDSKYIWIVDPLDGTTNFAHGLPIFAVSIALFKTAAAESSRNFDYLSGELAAGVVYAPKLNELFYAEKGKGAYLNKKRIKVSSVKKLSHSLCVTGFPPQHKEINFPYFEKMTLASQAARRLGSAALDLCYIAAGRFDIFWEFGLKPWDIAAGSLIVKEAAGHVTDTNSNQLDLFGADILATNRALHNQAIKMLNSR
ncbi:MAG: inositol monophosphatase family protein [Candidatus Peregrinibacteria bacterium]